jgi:hypothetical protein
LVAVLLGRRFLQEALPNGVVAAGALIIGAVVLLSRPARASEKA